MNLEICFGEKMKYNIDHILQQISEPEEREKYQNLILEEVDYDESKATLHLHFSNSEEIQESFLQEYFENLFPNTNILLSIERKTEKLIEKSANLFGDEFEESRQNITEIFDSSTGVEEIYEGPLTEEELPPTIDFMELIRLQESEMADSVLKDIQPCEKPKEKPGHPYSKKTKATLLPIKDLYSGEYRDSMIAIEGEVFNVDIRKTKTSNLVTFFLTDNESSFILKKFVKEEEELMAFTEIIKDGSYIQAEGKVEFDSYVKTEVMMVKSVNPVVRKFRMDDASKKRVELHLHSTMSAMDGVSSISDYIKCAKEWGHSAIALTDHAVVQAYPEAMEAAKKAGIKVLYGLEANVFDDKSPIVTHYSSEIKYDEFVVFDIETTGLTPHVDTIIEIGAVKIRNGQIVERFNELIDPKRSVSEFTTKLTGITNSMLEGKEELTCVLPKFMNFVGDAVVVAHNAGFDTGFIRYYCSEMNLSFKNPVMDTLALFRRLYPEWKNHKLDTACKQLNVSLENHHRAVDDANATAEVFLKVMEELNRNREYSFDNINEITVPLNQNKNRTFHLTILVQNMTGLKNLYRLVSMSHVDYFQRVPRIPKSVLQEYREGLLLGTACRNGELFEAIRQFDSEEKKREIVDFYDYVEIQPVENGMEAINNYDSITRPLIRKFNEELYRLGTKCGKIVVATGDVHYLEPHQDIYRRILHYGKEVNAKERERMRGYFYPRLHFRTTSEMLEEFSYLGEVVAQRIVVENTNKIAEMIEEIIPIPSGTFPPIWPGSEEEIRRISMEKAHEVYGEELPDIVAKRLERELDSIISNGYAIMYIIAQKLVWKSNDDGYLVGSRGSVGSSFVATMCGITEVNPLAPHYICPTCHYSDFETGKGYGCGVDMPDAFCPHCGTPLIKEGHNIPFEVFLGFEGDKEPDIDLNFAGEYQSVAHKYTEELFGEGFVFRAGTIGTVAEKTAVGYVLRYFEEHGKELRNPEKIRLAKGCTGAKRTTGQHPGGVMIVPNNKEIYDFSPVQYPADKVDSGVITTHFDYHSISGRILKLDILGHDVPTIIRRLEDLTGLKSTDIHLDDENTMKLFNGTEPLGLTKEQLGYEVGTLGIPEYGTKFVMQMLVETRPKTFSDLVRISGLSHGTMVWVGNAKDLVNNNIVPFNKVIATREDIMLNLIQYGMENKPAFTTMERVRKGKGLTPEIEEQMKELNVPDWYIDSCKKIQYMFPKAHAVAYVMMSYRIAYYKINYPREYYATYFSIKATDFNADYATKDLEFFRSEKERISALEAISKKEEDTLVVLDVLIEMYLRGYQMKPVDLYKSHAKFFIVDDDGKIIPPFITVEGLGENVAISICEEREKSKFFSKEDMKKRCHITNTSINTLERYGCLEKLSETDQLDFFSMTF